MKFSYEMLYIKAGWSPLVLSARWICFVFKQSFLLTTKRTARLRRNQSDKAVFMV
jgi:hypothetical protein